MRPRVYVAGPLTARNGWLYEANVRRAERVGYELVGMGAAPIVPHTMSRFLNETYTPDIWMEVCFAQLSVCNAMVLLPGWESSTGSCQEVAYCQEHKIPIHTWLDERPLCTIQNMRRWILEFKAA